ncbi:MAG: hypothetical protein ACRD5J_14360 [Nitrososphaeraceae archaeon]
MTELPWDWSDFNSSSDSGILEFDENDIISKINSNTIRFARVKFKIGSVVYQRARAEDIIDGFKELNTFFDFIRVVEVLMNSALSRMQNSPDLTKFEPETADFLKICYWYNNLKKIRTVEHRRKELRSRLCKELLYKLEKGKKTIDTLGLTDEEIRKKINDTLVEIRLNRSSEKSSQTRKILNAYLDYMNVCISELMFPALANELNMNVEFTPANNNYDFDIIINGHPTQIKTLFAYEQFPYNEEEKCKQTAYFQQSAQLREMYEKKQITWGYVEQQIIRYIRKSCIGKIKDALRQKAEIVILDGTRTIPGLALNYFYTDDSEFVKVRDSLIKAINNGASDFVNVIFASTVYDINFRISTLAIKIPVEKVNQVNEFEKDKITII